MAQVQYVVVEHDEGWAYKVGDVFSETFPTRDDAHAAAEAASKEQQRGGDDEVIEYQAEDGTWKVETAKGDDRPEAEVQD